MQHFPFECIQAMSDFMEPVDYHRYRSSFKNARELPELRRIPWGDYINFIEDYIGRPGLERFVGPTWAPSDIPQCDMLTRPDLCEEALLTLSPSDLKSFVDSSRHIFLSWAAQVCSKRIMSKVLEEYPWTIEDIDAALRTKVRQAYIMINDFESDTGAHTEIMIDLIKCIPKKTKLSTAIVAGFMTLSWELYLVAFCRGHVDLKLPNEDNGRLLLHEAVQLDVKFVEHILRHGGDPNARDLNGLTPLHALMARIGRSGSFFSFIDIICILVHYGADMTVRNNENIAPIDAIPPEARHTFRLFVQSRVLELQEKVTE